MKNVQKLLYSLVFVAILFPTVNLGAAQVNASQTQYVDTSVYGQGFPNGINQNQQTTGFFKDAIYPLAGDFNAATYNGHSQPGALDLTKGYNTYNQPIYAVKSGTVRIAQGGCTNGYIGNPCNGGYGNYVEIDHGSGYQTLYAHMIPNSIQVTQGQHVEKGDIIGYVGSTGNSSGPHLHFEVRRNNISQPVNRYFYIPNISYN